MENQNAYKMRRNSDPQTSKDAAISLDPTKLEKEVLNAVRHFGESGATMDQVDDVLPKLRIGSISPRFRPLIEKGFIKVDDRTRKGLYSNRQQRIHWATEYYHEDS